MSKKIIPLDKVQSVIAKIDLSPKLEQLLDDFSQWSLWQQEDWGDEFSDHVSGTESGTLCEFLNENKIGIRPSGFEFYQIEEE